MATASNALTQVGDIAQTTVVAAVQTSIHQISFSTDPNSYSYVYLAYVRGQGSLVNNDTHFADIQYQMFESNGGTWKNVGPVIELKNTSTFTNNTEISTVRYSDFTSYFRHMHSGRMLSLNANPALDPNALPAYGNDILVQGFLVLPNERITIVNTTVNIAFHVHSMTFKPGA